jgi:hypothetical protein
MRASVQAPAKLVRRTLSRVVVDMLDRKKLAVVADGE